MMPPSQPPQDPNPTPHPRLRLWLRLLRFLERIGLPPRLRQRLESRLSPELRQRLERESIVAGLRRERVLVAFGPLWMRRVLDGGVRLSRENRFLVSVFSKLLVASFFVLLPAVLFFLARGTLPVPERVSRRDPLLHLPTRSSLHTSWPWTDGPFAEGGTGGADTPVLLQTDAGRVPLIEPVPDPNAPLGLVNLSVGTYPRGVQMRRGFLVGERAPLTVRPARTPLRAEVRGQNRLRLAVSLLPAPRDAEHPPRLCRLSLKDANGELLAALEMQEQEFPTPLNTMDLTVQFWQRFTPDAWGAPPEMRELVVDLDSVPQKLTLVSESVEEPNQDATPTIAPPAPMATPPQGLRLWSSQLKDKQAWRDATDESCVFHAGDWAWERTLLKPLPRRGVVFVVVDTLRARTAEDPHLMPHLNKWAQEGLRFRHHLAQGNMTAPSLFSLFTSLYPRERPADAFGYFADWDRRRSFAASGTPTLARSFREAGYRTAAIGNMSILSEVMGAGVDYGFHDVRADESVQYETRHITEDALAWLEQYGESPFFLYLHYHTMHGPYRPPLSDLDLSRFLSHPFGLTKDRLLYDGLARYADREFSYLVEGIDKLGLQDKLDIVYTADHGAQLDDMPFGQLGALPADLVGASADKGDSLTDGEIRVPLILKLANSGNGRKPAAGRDIKVPSAHVDLFPTLLGLAEIPKPEGLRGVDLSQGVLGRKPLESLLNERNAIWTEGHTYAGVTLWGGKLPPGETWRYFRQVGAKDITLMLRSFPWSRRIQWWEPEQMARVQWEKGPDEWKPWIPPPLLQELRQRFAAQVPLKRSWNFKAAEDGTWHFRLNLSEKGALRRDASPPGVTLTDISLPGGGRGVWVQGEVKAGESLVLSGEKGVLVGVQDQDPHRGWVVGLTGQVVAAEALGGLLDKETVLLQTAPEEAMALNRLARGPGSVILSEDYVGLSVDIPLSIGAAGGPIRDALRQWGYAK